MARVQGPEAVPSGRIAADPGVRASPNAFGAQVGAALQGLGRELAGIAQTADQLKKRREGLNDATILNEADINLDNAYYDLQTELDDAAAEDSFDQFTERSATMGDEALAAAQEKHGATLSEQGRNRWAIRSAQMRNSAARRVSINSHNRQIQTAETTARQQFDDLRSFVFQNPGAEEEAVGKAKQLRENLIESGIGPFYIDQWIGTEKEVAEKLKKVRLLAQTDPNNPAFNPTEALDQMYPKSDLGTISNVGNWLGDVESGGRAQTNRLGYAGIHQFGAPRLQELGLYVPGEGENLQTWSKTYYKRKAGRGGAWEIDPNTKKWTGVFTIPGFGRMTFQQFMGNPAAQLQAWKIHERDIIAYVHRNGLDQYIGQTVHGVPITMNGMIAGAHIGGKAGMKNFILSGTNPTDENGTAIGDYMRRAAKVLDGQTNAVFAGMSPEDQAQFMQRGNAAMAAQMQQDQQALMSQRSGLDQVWDSSVSSAQETGQPVPWDEASAAVVYGWEKVNEQKRKEARALARYSAAAPLLTMSDRDAERYVIGLEQSAGTRQGLPGYADAVDAADYARRRLEKLRVRRRTAPAEAALDFPEVAEAFRAMMAEPNNPAAVQSYIGKSLRVQQGFNLPQPSTKQGVDELIKATLPAQHLPDVILKEIAKEFEDLPVAKTREEKVEQKEMLREKYNRMKGTFGEYTDEVILEAYQYMDRNDGTDEVVINSVRQIVRAGGADRRRAVTQEEKKKEVGYLQRLIDVFSGDWSWSDEPDDADQAAGWAQNQGRQGWVRGARAPDEPQPPEPVSDAPLDIELSPDRLLELAKDYARRGEDAEEWLDEQDYLTETQKKMVRARGGGGRDE